MHPHRQPPTVLFATELSEYLQKSVSSFLGLLTLFFFLFFLTKESTNNKNLVDKTFVKISHFMAWFVLGSLTAFGG
jgi:hypothetical protein